VGAARGRQRWVQSEAERGVFRGRQGWIQPGAGRGGCSQGLAEVDAARGGQRWMLPGANKGGCSQGLGAGAYTSLTALAGGTAFAIQNISMFTEDEAYRTTDWFRG